MCQPRSADISHLHLIDTRRDHPDLCLRKASFQNLRKFLQLHRLFAEQLCHLIEQADQDSVHLAVLPRLSHLTVCFQLRRTLLQLPADLAVPQQLIQCRRIKEQRISFFPHFFCKRFKSLHQSFPVIIYFFKYFLSSLRRTVLPCLFPLPMSADAGRQHIIFQLIGLIRRKTGHSGAQAAKDCFRRIIALHQFQGTAYKFQTGIQKDLARLIDKRRNLILRKDMLHVIIIGRKVSRNDRDVPVAQILLPHQIRDRPRRKMHLRSRIFRNVHGNLVRNSSVALPAAAEEILLQMKQGAALFKTRKGRFSEDNGRKEHEVILPICTVIFTYRTFRSIYFLCILR